MTEFGIIWSFIHTELYKEFRYKLRSEIGDYGKVYDFKNKKSLQLTISHVLKRYATIQFNAIQYVTLIHHITAYMTPLF